jgi:hypothetical protein
LIKLIKILDQHNNFSTKNANAILDNLGDGFLLEHNKFYKIVRDRIWLLGYTFSNEYNNQFIVLPFTQLEEIFLSQKILLLDNVTVLKNINLKALHLIEWSEIEIGFRKNYIFHESCHVIGREIISNSTKQPDLLKLLLEESFANACEFFGMCEANSEVHKIFYESNSYATNFSDQSKIQNKFGAEKVFKFTILSYLHSNFLNFSYTKSEIKLVTDFVFGEKLTSSDVQQLQFVAQVAFSLDDNFKQLTRQLHFKLNGLDEADFIQLKQNYLDQVIKSKLLANTLDSLVKVFYT